LGRRAAAGNKIGVGEGVVANGVAAAQLAIEYGGVASRELRADHEEGGAGVVSLEHLHEGLRLRRGAVVEADRHLLAARPVAVGRRPAVMTAGEAVPIDERRERA